jgi:hypothetical protein
LRRKMEVPKQVHWVWLQFNYKLTYEFCCALEDSIEGINCMLKLKLHPMFMPLPLAKAKNGKGYKVDERNSCSQWGEAACNQGLCFFLKIMWCGRIGDHPQGDFAKLGYRPTMKVEIYQNPFISWLLLNNVWKHGDFKDFFCCF